MAQFRVPQTDTRQVDQTRRFVQLALEARAAEQNQLFQQKKDLIQMEAQQERKKLINQSFQESVARIRSAISKPTNEYNQLVKQEASQWYGVPQVAKQLESLVRPEDKIVTRKRVDEATGATLEQDIAIDFSGKERPLTEPRVIDENLVTVKEEKDTPEGKRTSSTIIATPRGKEKARVGESTKEIPNADKNALDNDPAYRMFLQRKNQATAEAEKFGKAITDVDAQINATEGESILYENKIYKKGADTDTLKTKLNEKVLQAKKQEAEYQEKINAVAKRYTKPSPETKVENKPITLDELRAKIAEKMKKK